MAKLVTSLASCTERMTAGERKTAQRLEMLMGEDVLIWYDIPVGRDYKHPDFVMIDPDNGIIFLEVKDWKVSTIAEITPSFVILDVDGEKNTVVNPLEQARGYACQAVNLLSQERRLQQETAEYKGKLNLAWSYGVVFTNMTRRQLNSLSPNGAIERIFPEGLTICQDEMTESTGAFEFRKKIAGLFNTRFRPRVTSERRDIIRQILYPEVKVPIRKKQSGQIQRVMDIQQEVLARNIGEGHRVIHGVAGSGKTLILLYRCKFLAESSKKPVLVLCYNITLSNYLREYFKINGLEGKVQVYHFHAWCAAMARKLKLQVDSHGEYWENSFHSLQAAVIDGEITDNGYEAVLVDEGHDFDSHWLSLIATLFPNDTHSLLLMYDDAQSLYHRERALNFSLASVGILAQGRTSILKANYRNSQKIVNFAYSFSREYFDKHHNKEIPLVHPEAFGDEGDEPAIKHCKDINEEANVVVEWVVDEYTELQSWGDIAILCPTQFSTSSLTKLFDKQGIPYAISFSTEEKRNYSHKEYKVHLLTMQSSKGLEFQSVAVINASFVHKSSQDESQCIPALYVAFTRATNKLLVTYYRNNSISEHLDSFSNNECMS
ncbi:NERD domain-containing protein [Enterobacteriaceae bacterium H11S18]|uniref:3'-5' exonuclease n=1 Tax=Dryocola clanedunensis TaxID=2925396 RepID=UPI0022F11896|nr:nuclease-related domain-containing DEAD/DEAH box helicase [Dryocola clanedunensis]MCT4712248.1 NERD domain-containing protein [Dryocola clanedunensis]